MGLKPIEGSNPSLSASHKQKGPLLRALLFMTPTRDQSPRDSRVRQICRTQIWTSLRNPKRWPNGWSAGMCEIIPLSPPVWNEKGPIRRAFFIPASAQGHEPSRFEGSTSSPGANLIAASQDEAATQWAKRMDARSHPSLSLSLSASHGCLLSNPIFAASCGDGRER